MTDQGFTHVKVAYPLVELCSSEWSLTITSIQRFAGYWEISSCLLDSLSCVLVSYHVQ